MKPIDIDKMNARLSNLTDEFDSIGGYEVILAGMAIKLPEIYGENTARNFTTQLGVSAGTAIGEKILQKTNRVFTRLVNAIVYLFGALKKHYSVQIEEVLSEKEIIIRLVSYLDPIINKRDEINRGDILCSINLGYISSALNILIGGKVLCKHLDSKENFCRIKIKKL